MITKKIILPANLRETEMEVQVESEANQYIPFALDEVNLDFQVVGPAPNSPDDVEVLIAASRKEKVEDRVAAAEAAGLVAVEAARRHLLAGAVDFVQDELPTREKLALEAQSQINELEQTRTEAFQMNYQKAADVQKLLSDPNQRMLSKRGSAVVDARTNTLFVQDTPSRLEEVRKLIARIDVAVRQAS